MANKAVVFIHGLWIHANSWEPWVEPYATAGYETYAPGWPGDAADIEQTRANASALANQGIDDITRRYSEFIRSLSSRPIVIGHSFGGLIAQKLLADGQAAAAIAIDPGQIKGVKPLPLAQIRSGLPVLSRPGNKKKVVSLTKKQFRYAFGNALPEDESDELFERWTIPGRVGRCSKRRSPTSRGRRRRRLTPIATTAGRCCSSPAARTTPFPKSSLGLLTSSTPSPRRPPTSTPSPTAATHSSSTTGGAKSRT